MTPQNQLFIIVVGSLIGVVALIAATFAAVGGSGKKKKAAPPTLPDMTYGKCLNMKSILRMVLPTKTLLPHV